MASVVGARGQVTLDKQLRDDLGIEPGWQAVQRRVGERIELRFLPPRHRRSLRGALADPEGPSLPTEAALHVASAAAREATVREKHGASGGVEPADA